jgi:DNA-binding response OmpR family regulator
MTEILSVDDDQEILEVIKLILERSGYRVTTAANGKDALKQIQKFQQQIKLVLLDIMLPDMSGLDVFELLRRRNHKPKVIFISGVPATTEQINSLKRKGAVDYIEKPFSKTTLVQAVKNTLGPDNVVKKQ